ncbi:hypothetical protein CAPTEDRAFT_217211 [Capitella teleta]|uniref:Retrotransposon gag domain-containing protein n=1 Tax=Capitella teleta TaxID=283909 RepID=R7TVV7_CAPTE|nr:hypothetical protein CAPTEDRAFT_217211 [Capitella teleta]|eukprot:ELT97814.1 hypothetical protein CAPTEDRAFT_217211 [Capitella teleta]
MDREQLGQLILQDFQAVMLCLRPAETPAMNNNQLPQFQGHSEHSLKMRRWRSLPVRRSAVPTTQSHPSAANPRLPKFTGKVGDSLDWVAFIVNFERWAERYTWDDATRLDFLIECLQDQAAHFFSRLPPHHRCSYALLKEKLRTRFNVVQAPAVLPKQLQDVRQGMEESLQEFASRVQQLARDAHLSLIAEAVEPMAVDAFLQGCKEKLAAYSALNREPVTVELAVNLVEGAVTNQQAVFGSTVPVSKLRQVLRFENPTQTQPDDYQVRAVRASSVEGLKAAAEKRFRQCEGALVEVKAGLSSLSEQMKEAIMPGIVKNPGGHVHQLTGRETDTSRSGGATYDSTNLHWLAPNQWIRKVELHSTTGATILVDVEVGSGMIQAVVDTACQITVFSVTAWRNLCPSPSLGEEIILKGAAVLGRMKANMARDIQLRLGGQSYFWDCCVAPISDDLILGLDFLHAQGAVVDLPQALELTNLLSDYGDVFAISDTDLGRFEGIKHGIDTGGMSPIKQRMRRTPLGFAEEEDKYFYSMLKHGIIRPSFLDWASPPVLRYQHTA